MGTISRTLAATALTAAILCAAGPAGATVYFSGDAASGSITISDALFTAFSFGYYDVQVHGGCGQCLTAVDSNGQPIPGTFGVSVVSGPFNYLTNPPSGTTQSAIPGFGGYYEHMDGYGTLLMQPLFNGPALLTGANDFFGLSIFGGGSTATLEFDLNNFAHSDLVNLPTDRPLYLDITGATATPVSLSDLTPNGPTHIYTFTTPLTVDFTATLTDVSYADAYNLAHSGVVSGGVPEPASWALMISGFGLVGAAMRRRRQMPAAAFSRA